MRGIPSWTPPGSARRASWARSSGPGRDRKIVVVKFKRRKNYRRRQGHRQAYTQVRITRIDAGA